MTSNVTLVDPGDESMTAGRGARIRRSAETDPERFLACGDVGGSIGFHARLEFQRRRGKDRSRAAVEMLGRRDVGLAGYLEPWPQPFERSAIAGFRQCRRPFLEEERVQAGGSASLLREAMSGGPPEERSRRTKGALA